MAKILIMADYIKAKVKLLRGTHCWLWHTWGFWNVKQENVRYWHAQTGEWRQTRRDYQWRQCKTCGRYEEETINNRLM